MLSSYKSHIIKTHLTNDQRLFRSLLSKAIPFSFKQNCSIIYFILWMWKASKKHQEIKKKSVAQIHIITSCSYSTKLSPIFIIAFYPLSESWHRSERPAGLLIVPAALYRTNWRISPFESRRFLSEMIARIFIIVYNGIFIYCLTGCFPAFGVWMASCPWHGSRWSAPLDNRAKKIKE